MWEGERDCLRRFSPGGGPLSGSRDSFLRFRDPKRDLRVAQAACSLFIRDNMVERREDLVEVDGVTFEDALPLRGGDA